MSSTRVQIKIDTKTNQYIYLFQTISKQAYLLLPFHICLASVPEDKTLILLHNYLFPFTIVRMP